MVRHVVRDGETLFGIARQYGANWRTIASRNHIANPNRLHVRQVLYVDASSSASLSRDANPPPAAAASLSPVADRLTEAQLLAIMPTAGTRIARFLLPLDEAMRAHGIDTPERKAAFLAQISGESGELAHVEENLNYSARRLRAVWPRRFPNASVAIDYAHDPETLGNRVYADRLGNGDEDSGDGYRYRGRGLKQTTGRANYRAAGFEHRPEALAEPRTAADSAALFWSSNGLNARTGSVLDRPPFNAVSQTVNGGNNGSDARWAAYQRALDALGVQRAH